MENRNDFDNNNLEDFNETDKISYKRKDNSKQKKNEKIRLAVIFIVVFAVVFAGITVGFQLYNKSLIEPPETTTQQTTTPTINEKVENPIDFENLQSQNSDVYAWITVGNTEVDHPIVQSPTDDSFYLKRDALTKKWSDKGAIYTELVNSKDFNDAVTVIYGHNGYGSTMFTTLHRFEDEEFFNANEYFYIYTPDRRLTYQIISAFKYDDRHIMNSFNFANPEDLKDFQSYVTNPESSALKNVRTDLDTTIDENSKIVVLSTCITNQKSNRYLVCGVLVKDEETY